MWQLTIRRPEREARTQMPQTEDLLAFLTATVVFAYVPGPSMLYVMARTVSAPG